MYRIEVMYPNKPGSTFNLKHWSEVHLPMGLRLLKKHCGVTPVRVEAYPNPYAPPGMTAPYHLGNSLYFNTRDEADAFIRLFGIEEAARELKADWPNYTQSEPEVMISEVVDCDPVSGARALAIFGGRMKRAVVTGRSIAPPSLDTVVTIFLALAGWHANLSPISDNSTFCHLRTGDWMLAHGLPRADVFSFTAAGTPWVPESWLADLAYGVIDRATGPVGLIMFNAALGAALGALWYRLARRLSRDTTRATLISIVSIAASYTLWSPRPLMIGILAFLALVYIVEIPDSAAGRYPMLLLPALFWIWTNTHGSFVLGFAYLGLHLTGRWSEGARPWRGRERALLFAGALALAAGFINPYGYHLLAAPFHLAARYRTLAGVVEWRRASFTGAQGIAYLVWLAVFGPVLVTRPRVIGRRGLIVSLPFLALGLWSERNIAIAPLATFPIVARAWAAPAESAPNRRAFNWAMVALAAVFTLTWTVAVFRRPGFDFARDPVTAMRAVAARGLLGSRLLCPDSWGGYIELSYGPRQRVFMDDRYDLYPQAVTDDMSALLNGRGDWPRIVRSYDIEVVVWPAADRRVDALAALPGWKQIFLDKQAVVFSNR